MTLAERPAREIVARDHTGNRREVFQQIVDGHERIDDERGQRPPIEQIDDGGTPSPLPVPIPPSDDNPRAPGWRRGAPR